MIDPEQKAAFARAMEQANAFTSGRALRGYQQAIVETGEFVLASPVDGRPVNAASCHVANLGDAAHGNLGIAYRFSCPQPLWLLASSVKDGFPIAEAYLPVEDESIWWLEDGLTTPHGSWKAELRRLEAENAPRLAAPPAAGATVLLGHPNFAHHLWNELPALQVCLAEATRTGRPLPKVQALYEPLLPLGQLAPDGELQVARVADFDDVTGLRDGLVTRLGSTQVPASLRRHVVALLEASVMGRETFAAYLAQLAGRSPVFWISVRVDARTAVNQENFLLSLVTSLAAAYPDGAFIFDGFSYPVDLDHGIYRLGSPADESLPLQAVEGLLGGTMRVREEAVTAAVDELMAGLGELCANPLVSVSGRDLAEAITLAGKADYYVCHTGTLQHKIAWLHNTPGTVHANRAGLQPAAAGWLAKQLEGGRPPALVSRDLVEDLDSIRTPNRVVRNRDYRIVDIHSVVADILADVRLTLGGG